MLGFVRGTVMRRVVEVAVLPVSVNVVVNVSFSAPLRSAARALAFSLHVIVTVPAFFAFTFAVHAVAMRPARADPTYVADCASVPGAPTCTLLTSDTDEPLRTLCGARARRGVTDVGAVGVTAAEAAEAAEVPAEFVAVTVNVYAVPGVRPVTAHDVAPAATAHVPPPGLAVTT